MTVSALEAFSTLRKNYMEQGHKKQIKQIMSQMECPEDFRCYKSGFEDGCNAKEINMKGFLECLEENPQSCKFSMSFGYSYFCQCPLCYYIITNKLKG